MKLLINNGRISPLFFSTRGKLLTAITDRNIDVTLSGLQNGCDALFQAYNVSYESIGIERTGTNLFKDLALIGRYIRVYRNNQYSIVHSYTVKPNIYGSIAARLCGIKRIYPTVNGLGYAFTDTGKKTLKKAIIKRINILLYRIAFACSTNVFFQNPDDAEELIRHHAIRDDKCVLIPGSGIDLEKFQYAPPETTDTFFFASRLLITKGIRTFLEAAKKAKNEFPNVRFVVAGSLDPNPDGLSEKELTEAVSAGYIEYLGHVSNMYEKLKECSVFVLPSYYREGVPHAILEAMSVGRPIITCGTPGCKETVAEPDKNGKGKNGFLIGPNDSEALYEHIRWLITNPEEIKRMGKASREYAEKKFDVENVNKTILSTIGLW